MQPYSRNEINVGEKTTNRMPPSQAEERGPRKSFYGVKIGAQKGRRETWKRKEKKVYKIKQICKL